MGTHDRAAVGVDIGGTKINVGLIGYDGIVLLERKLDTKASERRVMEQVLAGIQALLQDAGEAHPAVRVEGIGIGTAGQVDFDQGSIWHASDLIPGYTGTPVRDLVREAFGYPVFVDNDVNVLALAEKRYGAGRDVRHLLCLALGTGVGGAVMTDGRLLHGKNGGAGEFGHVSVDFRGPACICGGRGCVELYASGTGIARLYREKTDSGDRGSHTAREVVQAWLKGEPAASDTMHEAIAALATAIANLLHSFNPEKVVVGGGVAETGEPFFSRLREEVRLRAMPSMLLGVDIVPAVMGNRSGMIGAAAQVWEYGQS